MPKPADTREEETQLYPCEGCGQPIRAPKGLKGVFTHAQCRTDEEQDDEEKG